MSKKSIKNVFKSVNQENKSQKDDIRIFKPNFFILEINKMTMQVITTADEETILNIFKKSSEDNFEGKSFDVILREKGYFCNVKQIKNSQDFFGNLF
ncbi:MAG TPA: hypothetical protein VK426_04665 [Methanobacterium sp.]|nr:hypothetical protein [Methanobacterium sp.]